ncbi:MAG: hypothetical protein QXS89_03765 [Sulfolobales archaeon]
MEVRSSSTHAKTLFIDLDLTITRERAIDIIARELGIEDIVTLILDSNAPEYAKSSKIAMMLRGYDIDYLKDIVFRKTEIRDGVERLLKIALDKGYEVHVISLTYTQFTEAVMRKIEILYKIDSSMIRIHGPKLEVGPDNRVTGRIIVDPTQRIKTSFCIECTVCKRFLVRVYGNGRIISIGDARPDACMFLESHYSIGVRSRSTRTIVRVNADLFIEDFNKHLDKISEVL